MSGKIIVIANRKGGVGKTTSALCLAHTFQAQIKAPTVVIDTDPQASASYALAGDALLNGEMSDLFLERILEATTLDARRPRLKNVVRRNVSALAGGIPLGLVPISPKFWKFEQAAWQESSPLSTTKTMAVRRFIKLLSILKEAYDTIIIDTPPGRSLLFEHSIRAADLILIPCIPDQISVWGLDVLKEELNELSEKPLLSALLWAQFSQASNWRDRVLNEFARTLPFDYIAEERAGANREPLGVGRYEDIPRAITDTTPRSYEERYPNQLKPHLLRICRIIRRKVHGDLI